MTPAIDLHRFPLRQRESAKIVRRHGEAEQKVDGWGLLRTSPTYLSRLSASVASLTRANHFGQHLSTFSSKGLPPRLRDPRLGDRDQLSAGQNLLSREGRQPSIDQPGNQACVETVGAQQCLRRAVAVRGCKHSESAPLFGTEAMFHHWRPLLQALLSARALTVGAMRTNNERLACETGSRMGMDTSDHIATV